MINRELKKYYTSEFDGRDSVVEKFSILRHLNDIISIEGTVAVRTPKSVDILKEAISYYLTYLSTQLELDQNSEKYGLK